MIRWQIEWGPNLEELADRAAKGLRVPALERRPVLPPHLAPALDCYRDLGGRLSWESVMTWASYYQLDFDELWDVLLIANAKVDKWQRSRSRSSALTLKPTSQGRS